MGGGGGRKSKYHFEPFYRVLMVSIFDTKLSVIRVDNQQCRIYKGELLNTFHKEGRRSYNDCLMKKKECPGNGLQRDSID